MSGTVTIAVKAPTLAVKLFLPQRAPLIVGKSNDKLEIQMVPFMIGPKGSKGDKGDQGDPGLTEISWNSINW